MDQKRWGSLWQTTWHYSFKQNETVQGHEQAQESSLEGDWLRLVCYIIDLDAFILIYLVELYCILAQVIAESLSEEEIMGLKEMFKSMDTDNSGTITFEELKAGLPKLGTKIYESEVRQLMEAVWFLVFVL